MANPNLTRKHQKIFSEFAPNNGQFGSLEASGGVTGVITNDITTLQALAAYQEGFNDAVISGDALPSLEEVNGLHKINTEQLQYLLNKGIPEWSADAEYYIGDIQREVGGSKIYQSITDNNINNALTDTLNWTIYYDPANGIFEATKTELGITFLPEQITIRIDAGDTNHDILFNAGNFQFDDGSGLAVLSSNLIKRIDAAWVAGNNQGGLFSGTVAANTTYHMFVISNDDGSLVDAGFSTDINAADIPTGYTKKRKIASLLTNASNNIRNGTWIFNRNGGYRFEYKDSILDVNTIISTNQILAALTIPNNITVSAIFDFINTTTNNINITVYGLASSPFSNNQTPTINNCNFFINHDAGDFRNNYGSRLEIPTNNGTIRFDFSAISSDVTYFVRTRGWIDYNL